MVLEFRCEGLELIPVARAYLDHIGVPTAVQALVPCMRHSLDCRCSAAKPVLTYLVGRYVENLT